MLLVALVKVEDNDHKPPRNHVLYVVHILALVVVVARGRGCVCETG